jgi:hypothetical protein
MHKTTFTQEIKDKWIAALTNGEYKQGKGYLRLGDTYCCLGVLCEILGWKLSKISNAMDKYKRLTALLGGDETRNLQRLNDAWDNPSSFKHIARYIKKNIPAV